MNSSQIVIVDSQPADYESLSPWLAAEKFQAHFFSDGRSALRSSLQLRSALWMINVDLPDRSGLEMYRMVSAAVRGPIFIVANRYDPEQELAALALGGAMYLCKPLQFDWIDQIERSLPARPVRPTAPRPSRLSRGCSTGDFRQRMANEFRRFWQIDLPIARPC